MPSFTAIVDLGAVQRVSQVAAGFLQESSAWIMMPRGIEVDVSSDGERWMPEGGAVSTTDPRDTATRREDVMVRFTPREARYVRVRITGSGTLPPWHLGAGEMSWVFVDEIEVR